MDLWRSWNILRRRFWVAIIAGVVLFFILNVHPQVIGPQPVPNYVSTAKLLMNPPRPVSYGEVGQVNPSSNWMANLTILSELLLGRDLLTRVLHRARVEASWTDLRNSIELKALAGDPNQVTMLQISVTWGDGKTAAALARALVDEFIDYSQEISAREFASTRKFLQGLVDEAKGRLGPAESELMAWRRSHKVLDAGQVASERQAQVSRLEQQYATAIASATRLKDDVKDLQTYVSTPGGTPPWIILSNRSDAVSAMEERLAQARIKLSDLQRVYEPGAQVVRLQQQAVNESNELLQHELSSYVESLLQARQAQLRDAEQSAASAKKAMAAIADSSDVARDQLQYARLERQISTWDKNYQSLMEDLYRARVAEQSSSRQGAITVVQEPEDGEPVYAPAPKAPTRRSTSVVITLSILFGISAAFAFEYLITSLQVRARIEETLGVPVLGAIPRLPRDYVKAWDEMKRKARLRRTDESDTSAGAG